MKISKRCQNSPQGWQNPTLRYEAGQWRIYSDGGSAFVPLDKATDELLDACSGARTQLDEDNNAPF
jgi:hypothetical protein